MHYLRREHVFYDFMGEHPAFLSMVGKLKKLATKNITVLLIGETGSGKGRCAEFIHQCGDRHKGPFIPYNCGLGSEHLFESQLFGHARGSFTGAHRERPGLVEETNGGILFLDEINSLTASNQVRLNHFLETKTFRRLGENRLRRSNIRVIAASNMSLCEQIAAGRFRKDLYYRLAEWLCVGIE